MNSNANASVIVFGEGSAAVFLISQLVKQGESVIWASGSGAKILPVMPYVKSELALGALLDSQKLITDEVFAHPVECGIFHRVFRNKGFKLPTWKKTANLEAQKQAFEEMVWAPEQAYLGVQELRIAGLTPAKVEQDLRELFENHAQVKRVGSAPVVEVEVFEKGGKIQFANGVIAEFKQFYFCDSLTELKAIPKLFAILKHQMGNVKSSNLMSALQVVFHHKESLNTFIESGLVVPMNRDSGDDFDRDVLGYFAEPNKSVWTVFLQASECEENHEIMKKLRKMKQALNKAFDGPDFMPEGYREFMGTVEKEQVRLEASFLAVNGTFQESTSNHDFVLLADSFGFSEVLEQIAKRFEIEPVAFDSIDSPAIDEVPEMPLHLRSDLAGDSIADLNVANDTLS